MANDLTGVQQADPEWVEVWKNRVVPSSPRQYGKVTTSDLYQSLIDSWRQQVPKVKVNGGDFVFSVKTKQVIDGWVGIVLVDGIEVWEMDAPRETQDQAYGAAKRAVAKAFKRLLDGK